MTFGIIIFSQFFNKKKRMNALFPIAKMNVKTLMMSETIADCEISAALIINNYGKTHLFVTG